MEMDYPGDIVENFQVAHGYESYGTISKLHRFGCKIRQELEVDRSHPKDSLSDVRSSRTALALHSSAL